MSFWFHPHDLAPDLVYELRFYTLRNVHAQITTRNLLRTGVLHVTPTSGIAVLSKFTVDATIGWGAEESLYPLSYYFTYTYLESPDVSWPLGEIYHDLQCMSDIRLPCGGPTDTLIVTVSVCDRNYACLDASTKVNIQCPPSVLPPVLSEAFTDIRWFVTTGFFCRAMSIVGSLVRSPLITNDSSISFETELGKLVDNVVIETTRRIRHGFLEAPLIAKSMIQELACVLQHIGNQNLSVRATRHLIHLQRILLERLRLETSSKSNNSFSAEETQLYTDYEVDDQVAPVSPSLVKMVEIVLFIEKLHFEVNRKNTVREKTNGHFRRMAVLLTTTCRRRAHIPMTVTLPYMDIGIVSIHLFSRKFTYNIMSTPIKVLKLSVRRLLTAEDMRCWQQCISYIKYTANFVTKHMKWLVPLDKSLLSTVVFLHLESCALNCEQKLLTTRLEFPLEPEHSPNYTRCYSWTEGPINLKPCETTFVQENIRCSCDTLANSYMGLLKGNENVKNGDSQNITDNSGTAATEVTCVIHPTTDFRSEIHELFESTLRHQIARAIEIDVRRILSLDLLPKSGILRFLVSPRAKGKTNKILLDKLTKLITRNGSNLNINGTKYEIVKETMKVRNIPVVVEDIHMDNTAVGYTSSVLATSIISMVVLLVVLDIVVK
ncbi:uncharacterized protein LOC143235208 [Tachypleus tridentatus]|uniref:uncharacterized protein LOC143235208 n=1 Tax=Tachypleus tridentatus TaxID=6853 RepID=UPI003FD159BE